MNNKQRLQLEIKGITLTEDEINVYLLENGLTASDTYNAQSNTNKKNIYAAALSILESIANNPTMMKSIKVDDMTVSEFHENLMKQIDQLDNKVRTMPSNDNGSGTGSSFFIMYN